VSLQIVAAPPATVPRHSLLRAALTGSQYDGEEGWERGLTYAPETPGGYRGLASCSAEELERLNAGPTPAVEYRPWFLQIEHPCRTTFGYDDAEVSAQLGRALDATESYAIARELWTGELTRAVEAAGDLPDGEARNLSLMDGPTVLGGGPVSGKRAVGLLEQYAGDALRGQRVYLHTSPEVFPYLPDTQVTGELLTTKRGSMIVADAGYPNTAPGNVAPAAGVGWIVATGPVLVRRGRIEADGRAAEYVDTDTNTLTRRTGRPVAATFDRAAHFAVAVTLD
jgi:hypothetical protein